MKRVGYLYDKLSDYEILKEAHSKASKNKKHYAEVMAVEEDLDSHINKIRDLIVNKEYVVKESDYVQRHIVDKGKERVLNILPYYPHRIIQWAIILVTRDIFEGVFISTSYASIEGKGQLKASLDLRDSLKDNENKYYLQLDIKKFYPNIDREILKMLLRKKFKDKALLRLLDMIIDSAPDDKGIPLGSLLSQWLGNYYLTYFDHFVKETLSVKDYFRYCDDLIILGGSREGLNVIKNKIETYLNKNLKLLIKPTYRLRSIDEGIDFVGYVHYVNKTKLRRRIKYSLRSTSHELINKHKRGEDLTLTDLSRIMSFNGWVKHCDCGGLRNKYIEPIMLIFDKQASKKRGGI